MLPQLQMDDGSFPDEATDFKTKNVHVLVGSYHQCTDNLCLRLLSIFKYCYYQPTLIHSRPAHVIQTQPCVNNIDRECTHVQWGVQTWTQ